MAAPGGAAPQRAGAAPPLARWSTADVCARLEEEGVTAVTRSRFRQYGVSGEDLLTFERDDLRQQLGLTDPSDREAAWAAVLRIRESAAPAAAESPQTAPSPAPARPLSQAAGEGGARPESSPAAAALQLVPIYVDFRGETHCVEVSHLATVGELAAAVPGQGEMGVVIYFGGEALGSMTTLADAGIGAEARVEARSGMRIIATGDNEWGQLGLPPAPEEDLDGLSYVYFAIAAGLQPPQGAEIAEVVCGGEFVLLRTNQGDVLHAGSNRYWERGDGGKDDAPHPELFRVPLPGPAVSIAAGEVHAAAVLADGSVITWGHNGLQQLGRVWRAGGDDGVPQAVPGISDAYRVTAGLNFIFVHRRGDEVSAWGQNNHGQLCLGRASWSEAGPQRVAALCGVSLLHLAGGEEHCIALRADGYVLVWGMIDNRLADGSRRWTEARGCQPIELRSIGRQLCVSAARGYCGAVGTDGVLRVWGCDWARQPTALSLPGGASARKVVCGRARTVFACAAGGEWAEMKKMGNFGLTDMFPLPEEVAGCRHIVTGVRSYFQLYLCAQ